MKSAFQKESLYLHKIGVMSAYILPSPNPPSGTTLVCCCCVQKDIFPQRNTIAETQEQNLKKKWVI